MNCIPITSDHPTHTIEITLIDGSPVYYANNVHSWSHDSEFFIIRLVDNQLNYHSNHQIGHIAITPNT